MTDVADPGLELWERLEAVEGFSMEYIHGEIIITASPNTIHNRIVNLVLDRFSSQRFTCWSTQAIAIHGYPDRTIPDLTVTGADLADEYFQVIPSESVLFVLEVVSPSRPSIRRDYEDKPEIYAQGHIPLYLLVDPNIGTWLLHSDPDSERGEYRTIHKGSFGELVQLPAPVEASIPTDRFRVYPT